MMIITEVGLLLFAGIFLCFYAADVLYYIYENEIEKKQKEIQESEFTGTSQLVDVVIFGNKKIPRERKNSSPQVKNMPPARK